VGPHHTESDHGDEEDGGSQGASHSEEEVIRHARIELPGDDYTAVKEVARSNGLGVAAYIRMAILQRVRRDRAESEGGGK